MSITGGAVEGDSKSPVQSGGDSSRSPTCKAQEMPHALPKYQMSNLESLK